VAPMDGRRQSALFLGLVALVVAVGFTLGRARNRGERDALCAVPRDAWLVATLDVAALRASPIARPILEPGGGTRFPGLKLLSETCAFDPLARVRQIVVAAPEGGDKGELGIAFAGDWTKDELVTCTQKLIARRGGRPSISVRGAFTMIEDASDAVHARVAYREGGPFLVGRGVWLDAMIDAASSTTVPVRSEHAALRESLSAKGAPTRALMLTVLLPKPLRERLKAEMGAEIGGRSNEAFAGVLSVNAAGIAVTTGGAGSTTEMEAELRCESAADCDEVGKLIERKRAALSGDITLRLMGLGGLLDALEVRARGAALSIESRAPTDELARALAFVAGAPGGDAGIP
jgi:hypothetical protein